MSAGRGARRAGRAGGLVRVVASSPAPSARSAGAVDRQGLDGRAREAYTTRCPVVEPARSGGSPPLLLTFREQSRWRGAVCVWWRPLHLVRVPCVDGCARAGAASPLPRCSILSVRFLCPVSARTPGLPPRVGRGVCRMAGSEPGPLARPSVPLADLGGRMAGTPVLRVGSARAGAANSVCGGLTNRTVRRRLVMDSRCPRRYECRLCKARTPRNRDRAALLQQGGLRLVPPYAVVNRMPARGAPQQRRAVRRHSGCTGERLRSVPDRGARATGCGAPARLAGAGPPGRVSLRAGRRRRDGGRRWCDGRQRAATFLSTSVDNSPCAA